MNRILLYSLSALLGLLLLTPWDADAQEPADTAVDQPAALAAEQPRDRLDFGRLLNERISFGLGWHLYYGGRMRETGVKPDGREPIEIEEIHYTLRDEFDLATYHGPALQIEWEHLIIPQFGMAWGVGFFGGTREIEKTVDGAEFSGVYAANALYLTLLAPRGHWRISPRWDLSGGIDVALCSFAGYYVVDVEIDGQTFQIDETIYGFTPLYSATLELELRLSRHWGLVLTNKASWGKVEADEGNLVIGGNLTLLSAAVHF